LDSIRNLPVVCTDRNITERKEKRLRNPAFFNQLTNQLSINPYYLT
jgi:hypothetical protein